LSQNPAYISASFWNHQEFLINSAANSVIFNLYNAGSVPAHMVEGMYHLHVHTNGCLIPSQAPISCIPPNPPPFAIVYKHPAQPFSSSG